MPTATTRPITGTISGTFSVLAGSTETPLFTLSVPGTSLKSDPFPANAPFAYAIPVGLYTIEVVAPNYYKLVFPDVHIQANHTLQLPTFLPLIPESPNGDPGLLVLHGGISTTSTPTIQIFLAAKSDTTTMQLAESLEDLAQAPVQPFASLFSYTFTTTTPGSKKLYVQLSHNASPYPPLSDVITLLDPIAPTASITALSATQTNSQQTLVSSPSSSSISTTTTTLSTSTQLPPPQVPLNLQNIHELGCNAAWGGVGFFAGGLDAAYLPQNTLEALMDASTQPVATTLQSPRYHCTAVATNSHVILLGGYNTTGLEPKIEDYLWNATTQTLKETGAGLSLHTPRDQPAVVPLSSLVLVAGGNNDPALEVFQVTGTQLVATAPQSISLDGSSLAVKTARTDMAGAALGTASVLFIGGKTLDNKKSAAVDVFSLSQDANQAPKLSVAVDTPPVLTEAKSQAVAVSFGGFVVVAGGLTAQDTPTDLIEIFGMVGTHIQNVGQLHMQQARTHVSAVVAGKFLFLAGGETTSIPPKKYTPLIEVFQLGTDNTKPLIALTPLFLSSERTSIYGAALSPQEVIFTGGIDTLQVDVFRLDSTTNQWSQYVAP